LQIRVAFDYKCLTKFLSGFMDALEIIARLPTSLFVAAWQRGDRAKNSRTAGRILLGEVT